MSTATVYRPTSLLPPSRRCRSGSGSSGRRGASKGRPWSHLVARRQRKGMSVSVSTHQGRVRSGSNSMTLIRRRCCRRVRVHSVESVSLFRLFRALPFQNAISPPRGSDQCVRLPIASSDDAVQNRVWSRPSMSHSAANRTTRQRHIPYIQPCKISMERETHSASVAGGAHGGHASVLFLRAALSSRHRRESARHWCSAPMGRAGAAYAGERCSAASMAELAFLRIGERWRGCASWT